MADLDIAEKYIPEKAITLLELIGSLDGHNFQLLKAAIDRCFEQDCYKLIFDLTKLDYASSAGYSQFVAAMSEALRHNGMIVLVNPTEFVDDVMRRVGLAELFPVAKDIHKAAAMFK